MCTDAEMKTLKRNQTKLLLWSANAQYQSAVIYENTLFVRPLARIDDYILLARRSFMSPSMAERGKTIFSPFVRAWELSRQMMMARRSKRNLFTHKSIIDPMSDRRVEEEREPESTPKNYVNENL